MLLSLKVFSTRIEVARSMALVLSSRSNTSGLRASAMASAARCDSPPESVLQSRSNAEGSRSQVLTISPGVIGSLRIVSPRCC
mmetsp:Transcript_4153/g.10786  ORF Transcript_4153/g.10786 Transcript_4153/m.10786 type:complete len:83 (+) Transcript_4153:143-391(+)